MDDDSAEASGGTAYGLNAYSDMTDGKTLASLDRVMTEMAEWIKTAAGCFLGHIKMAVTADDSSMTLNLTDIGADVEHHGSLKEGVRMDIRFMVAVVDVDRDELAGRMRDALAANGFKIKNKKIIELR